MDIRKVVVIGAGIGGLAAAIELRRAGLEATAYERREELAEVNLAIRRRLPLALRDAGFRFDLGQRLAVKQLMLGGRLRGG